MTEIIPPQLRFFGGFVDMGIMMINQCLLSDKVCHASAKDNGKFHGDAYGVHCRTHERGRPTSVGFNLVKGYNGNRFLDNVWPQVWQCITVTANANSLGGEGHLRLIDHELAHLHKGRHVHFMSFGLRAPIFEWSIMEPQSLAERSH